MVAPYRHVLAVVLLVNESRRDHFATLLGLVNQYEVVRVTGNAKTVDEAIYSDEDDLDDDRLSNGDEYDIVVGSGGGIFAFAATVITPNNPALPLATMAFVLCVALLLAVSGCALLRPAPRRPTPSSYAPSLARP